MPTIKGVFKIIAGGASLVNEKKSASFDKPAFSRKLPAIIIRLLLAYCFSLVTISLTLTLSAIDFVISDQALITGLVIIILALTAWRWQVTLIMIGSGALFYILSYLIGNSPFVLYKNQIEYARFWLIEAFYWLIAQPNYFPLETISILGLLIGGIIAVFCYLLVARTIHPWLMLVSVIGLTIARRAIRLDDMAVASMIGLALTFIAFALKQPGWKSYVRPPLITIQNTLTLQVLLPVVSVVLITTILTSVISPVFITGAKRPQAIEDLVSYFSYPGNTGNTSANDFSIETAGYYPIENNLGGPVTLSPQPVFSIAGSSENMLVKGSVSVDYSGNSWQRLPMAQDMTMFDFSNMTQEMRQVFEGHIAAELKENEYSYDFAPDYNILTEQERVSVQEKLDDNGLLRPMEIKSMDYEIRLISQGIRSIFYSGIPAGITIQTNQIENQLPFDLTDIWPFDEKLYFNRGGAIYTAQPFLPGYGYAISSYELEADPIAFPIMYKQFMSIDISDSEFDPENILLQLGDTYYLQLPDLPEYGSKSSLRQLVIDVTDDLDTQYERAEALRVFLQTNNKYKLDVAVPPADREFVSWFLEQREGYCVYFATALTMLCRLAGIPARYVEGYYVPGSDSRIISVDDDDPNENNSFVEGDYNDQGFTRTITGQQAHAWTEVYIDPIGWVAMDATPAGGEAAVLEIAGEHPQRDEPLPEITMTPQPTIVPQPTPGNNSNDDLIRDDSASILAKALRFVSILIIVLMSVILAAYIFIKLLVKKIRKIFVEDWWLSEYPDIRSRIKLVQKVLSKLMPSGSHAFKNGLVWSKFAEDCRYDIFSMTHGTVDAREWKRAADVMNEALYGNGEMLQKQWEVVWHVFSNLLNGLKTVSTSKLAKLRLYLYLTPLLVIIRKHEITN